MTEEIIDLRKLFKIIGAYKWLILVSIVVFLITAVAVTASTPPTYETSISLVVGPNKVEPARLNPNDLKIETTPQNSEDASRAQLNYQRAMLNYQSSLLNYQMATFYQNLLSNERFFNTFGQVLQSSATVSLAMKEAALSNGSYSVKATPTQTTQFITVAVQGNDPEKIRRLATAIGKVAPSIFKKVIGESDNRPEALGALFNVSVIDPAATPTQPIQPKLVLNLALLGFVGLMVGLGLAFLFNYLKMDA